jgi:hypothetical protein
MFLTRTIDGPSINDDTLATGGRRQPTKFKVPSLPRNFMSESLKLEPVRQAQGLEL